MKIIGLWTFALLFLMAAFFPVWGVSSAGPPHKASLQDSVEHSLSHSEEIELVFVGDIMLSRGVGDLIKKKNNPSYPYLLLQVFLQKADLTFGNLENPVSDRGAKVGSIYSFRADPETIDGLRDAGFDMVNLANNHIWDYGREAFLDTLDVLKNSGIDFVGAGLDYNEAHTPAVKETKGTKIAFLGYTNLIPRSLTTPKSKPAIASINYEQLLADIQAAKVVADLVVVNFHWGDEYQTKHNAEQEKIGKSAIDYGADLVVGHHPHVSQEIEKYGDGYVAYSLGNFVFDQNFSEDTGRGLALKVSVRDKKIQKVEGFEIGFNSTFQPFFIRK